MSSLAAAYAFSPRLHESSNADGLNYWYVYVEEILSRIGACPRPLDLSGCAEPEALAGLGVLVLGDFRAGCLPAGAEGALTDWVAGGGILIGFATEGLDGLFGIVGGETIPQARGPFSINGYFRLSRSAVTRGCRPRVAPGQKLIIISPIRLARCTGSRELARLFLCDRSAPEDGARAVDADSPAISHRRLGAGSAFYFAFNVAQTMWVLHQGRPVDRDYDGDGYLRTSDACVLGQNSLRVPYSEVLHFLLANMMGRRPVPMLHQIPPRQGQVSPALLFFGGDDECEPENQLIASKFMAERGLPYHINAMPLNGRFAIDRDSQARIEANGHEIALHFNFIDGFDHPCGFSRDDVLRQASLFRRRFGRDSVCGVLHWCRWTGWAEPARWILETGAQGDNSFLGWTSPPANPVNTVGFAHGSAFPRFFWDDAAHGNSRVDLLQVPIVAYEVGYVGDDFRPEKMRKVLDLAIRYHLTLNFFWHPIYIARSAACRRAIDDLVRLMGDMRVPPVMMGADELCRWWRARSHGAIRKARRDGGRVLFEAECDYGEGFVVKVPAGNLPASRCRADGVSVPFESAHEFGQYWAFLPLGPGSHSAELELGQSGS